MNIFFLHTDPQVAAEQLCDKHLSKMQLETAQLLSTAHRLLLPDSKLNDELYKATHANHPSAVWLRQSTANTQWLAHHANGMAREWAKRGHANEHKSYSVSLRAADSLLFEADFASTALTDVPLCIPDDLRASLQLAKHVPIDQAVSAYRAYYRRDKAYMATWPADRRPDWL